MASPLWRPGGLVWRWRWSRPAGGVTETAPMSGSTPDKSRSAVRQTPAAHVAPPKPKSKPRSKPPRPRLSAGRPCPARPSCLCALRGRRARGIRRGRGGQSGQGHRRLRRLSGPNLCRTWHYTLGGYFCLWEGGICFTTTTTTSQKPLQRHAAWRPRKDAITLLGSINGVLNAPLPPTASRSVSLNGSQQASIQSPVCAPGPTAVARCRLRRHGGRAQAAVRESPPSPSARAMRPKTGGCMARAPN